MKQKKTHTNKPEQLLDGKILNTALTSLGRTINIVSTYGNRHPAFSKAIDSCHKTLQKLLSDRKKITLGAIHGKISVDGILVETSGSLLKSLEHRLIRLRITGLRIAHNISKDDLSRLIELLANAEAEEFNAGIEDPALSSITSDHTRYEAIHEDETVANKEELASTVAENGVLVLDDGLGGGEGAGSDATSVHVEQIVAFLKGDVESDEEGVDDELANLASDPNQLGKLIMESVAIRQQSSALSGESLNEIILGCLRRTYDGLRKQPSFQTSDGIASLQKSLLLLEKSMLDKMHLLAGEPDPELDRKIVQAVQEMDESLDFERSATQYIEHRQALEENKIQLTSYLQEQGIEKTEDLLANTNFPPSDWRRIVVDSHQQEIHSPPIADGLKTLTSVFEKLEVLMKSDKINETQIKSLLGQANEDLDHSLDSTKEKLQALSQHLEDTGTIGGQGRKMPRKELLSSIAEISQELMQPLTAISASLEMMVEGFAGEISPDQRTILDIASNSGIHLTFLMKELIAIVGCPTSKGVDERFHTTSEKVVLLEQHES